MTQAIKSVYVAQTFRGDPDCIPIGLAAAKDLRERGYEVFSPAERQEEVGVDPNDCTLKDHKIGFKWDLACVLKVDAVVVINGIDTSRGVKAEVALALAIETPVLSYPDLTPVTAGVPGPVEQALDIARATFAKKNADYAHDDDWRSNFDDIARQMGFDAVTACDTLIAVKQARLKALNNNGRSPVNEGVEDTRLDRMVYGIINFALYLDDKKKASSS